MNIQKSKQLFLRSNHINDHYKKQHNFTKESNINSKAQKVQKSQKVQKQYKVQKSQKAQKISKCKKSSSQPIGYFLNKGQIKFKKTVDVYKSQEKLIKSLNKLNKSKSLYNHQNTPEKRNPITNLHNTQNVNGGTFKKNTVTSSTVNNLQMQMNRGLESNEKTKRLTLNRTNTESNQKNMVGNQSIINLSIFISIFYRIIQDLQSVIRQSSNICEKLKQRQYFFENYQQFFEKLKQSNFEIKKQQNQLIKHVILKISLLLKKCQQKKYQFKQKQIISKGKIIQNQLIKIKSELKKKQFKQQILINQINQIKDKNIKLIQQLQSIKSQNKILQTNAKKQTINNQKFKIIETTSLSVIDNEIHIKKPRFSSLYYMNLNSNLHQQNNKEQNSQKTVILYDHKEVSNFDLQQFYKNQTNWLKNYSKQKQYQNSPQQQHPQKIDNVNQFDCIKKIRSLEKKQKQFIRTLLVLKNDGIDIQRAFQEALNEPGSQVSIEENDLNYLKKYKQMPKYVKKIKNNDSYEAGSSILDTMQDLTINYLEGQAEQQYIFYPIKNEYKSKPLPNQIQNKLKLDFNILYQECQFEDEVQNGQQEQNEDSFPNSAY